jgi:hypothetical protein
MKFLLIYRPQGINLHLQRKSMIILILNKADKELSVCEY